MKNEVKSLYSTFQYMDLSRNVTDFIVQFCREIEPLIELFGLWDDEHIRKYINSYSVEDIYADALAQSKENVEITARILKSRGENIWVKFRADDCNVESPSEPGFVFRVMPLAYDRLREKWLKAISVEDCHIKVSDSILRQESFVPLTQRQKECVEMVTEFCEAMKSKNWGRKGYQKILFFTHDKDGDLAPNIEGIVFGSNGIN